MTKVSVILPVYGVADYIEACTRSLLEQTIDDAEFIFVDDHGPDDSIAIARRTVAGHPREGQFRFVRPGANLGAGMARNFGLDQATGEYIAFIDPDDTVEPDMLQTLYDRAKLIDADICCCYMQKRYPDGTDGELLKNPYVGDGTLSRERRTKVLANYVSLFASMIYRRSMIEACGIRFPEERAADDSYFVSCVWMMAHSVAYVDRPFYHYLIRPGSVTTTLQSDKYLKRLAVFAKMMQYARDHKVYDAYRNELDYVYLKKGYLSSVANYIRNSSSPQTATLREIREEMLRQTPLYHTNPYFRHNKPMRVMFQLLRRCPRLAIVLMRRYIEKNNIVS